MTRIMVIIGSVRPGRVGLPIGAWVVSELEATAGVEVDLADLAEVALPFMDEPNHPILRSYTKPHTIAWSERVAAADAFVIVVPEYNHSSSPVVKNALDFLHHEWKRKAVVTVSYGGVSAGTRGVVLLQPALVGVGLVPTIANPEINFPTNHINDEGVFEPTDTHRTRLGVAVAEAIALSEALKPLRG